jgi:hypothetical protein
MLKGPCSARPLFCSLANPLKELYLNELDKDNIINPEFTNAYYITEQCRILVEAIVEASDKVTSRHTLKSYQTKK